MNKPMKTRSFLLPHVFRYIGWGIFLFTWIFLLISIYAYNTLKLFAESFSHYGTPFVLILLYLSALLVAFSKEKHEDEYIRSIRADSIIVTAFVSFLLFLLFQMVLAFDKSTGFLAGKEPVWNWLAYSVNSVTMFVVYVAIFRIRLFRLGRALRYAE